MRTTVFDPDLVKSGCPLTVNEKTYFVISMLGKGKGGYSYLVTDGARRYVLKQIHHEPCDYYRFGDKLASECRDYARLEAIGIPMPKLLDVDAEQERLLKEFIDGPTAAELIREGRMQKAYVSQVERMCERLYAHHTNIDYYPTNFVLLENTLYYVDYECNDYMQEWDFAHWGKQYWKTAEEEPT